MKRLFLLFLLCFVPQIAQAQTDPPLGLTALKDTGEIAFSCPLQRTEVETEIAGMVARVKVRQRFSNPSKTPIEALYTFPLPHDAAVDDMTLQTGERVIKGEIRRREEARQVYEAAKRAGQSAALLDQERPNIFTQRVANLLPGAQVSVEIAFVQPIQYHDGKYEWVLPTVVGPRYTPTGGYTKPGERGAPSDLSQTPADTKAVVTDAEKITPPITPENLRAGHDLTLQINLQSPVELGEISSPLHPIETKRRGNLAANIKLRDGATIPNKDFVLRWQPQKNNLQTGVVAFAEAKGGYFSLVLQPPVAPPKTQIAAKEMVFVIDQTGSQSGLPIQKAKETMRYCIAHLNPGDSFQLLGFTTVVNPCFEKPVEATPDNVAKATAFLEKINAGGGTDILKAADYALQLPIDQNRPRIVCFMTDGYVGNDMQILDYVRKNRDKARMFPFGVGNSVNRFLIDNMAREGRGVAEYVLLNEDGEKAAQRFYNRVAHPLLLNIEADWGNLPVADVYPKAIPDLYESAPLVLTGRYTGAANGEITVRGTLGGKPWSQKVRVELPTAEQSQSEGAGEGLPSLWARSRIEDLQSEDWMGAQSGKPNPELKEQIVNVALEYRLMSQYTSFVAVEQRVINVGGEQKTVDVPVEMPEGVEYQGIFGGRGNGIAIGGNIPVIGSLFRARSFGNSGTGGWAAGYVRPMPGPPQSQQVSPPSAAMPAPQTTTSGVNGVNLGAIAGNPGIPAFSPSFSYSDKEFVVRSPEVVQKQLDALKPEERRALLRKIKLSPKLDKATGQLTIQIWLNAMKPDEFKILSEQLKKLGFEQAAILRPNQLILGTIAAEKLDEILAMREVRFVEAPVFK